MMAVFFNLIKLFSIIFFQKGNFSYFELNRNSGSARIKVWRWDNGWLPLILAIAKTNNLLALF